MNIVSLAGEKGVHEIFELQAAERPQRVALSFGGREMTYGDLNADANRLATHLRKRGAVPGAFIGICLDLSQSAVVAVLAVLKTGAAYVPISPQEPFRRVDEIIRDAELAAVVTRLGLRHRIPDSEVDLVLVDEDFRAIANEPSANLNIPGNPGALAYVTYTSGTTGRPKGVLSVHASVTNGLMQPPFDPHADDAICVLTAPLRFGFSVSAMFLPLCCGQKLVVVPESSIGNVEQLIEIFESEGVTNVVLTPTMLKEIVGRNTPLASRLHKLRTIGVSGMALSGDLVQSVGRALPKVRLLNGYAASEIGGAAVVSEIKGPSDLQSGGLPFPNTEVYILDEKIEPTPIGETGEIYVGAPHLSWGYLNQPGLTTERFLPDPFSTQPGSRMYRTGDLGCRRADGRIEVIGRTDDQVKVRGFRVELGEVETVLREHPLVLEAAVIADSAVPEDIRLIAYAVVGSQEVVSTKALRDFITDRLPQYMVPATFVVLNDSLPRTALGKVDRQCLPIPDRPGLATEFEAPRTPVEAVIAQIWTELLGLEQIGLHDSFLELGGHSLLAAQAIARIRGRLAVQMSPQEFLERPTIAEQAQLVERSRLPQPSATTARS